MIGSREYEAFALALLMAITHSEQRSAISDTRNYEAAALAFFAGIPEIYGNGTGP